MRSTYRVLGWALILGFAITGRANGQQPKPPVKPPAMTAKVSVTVDVPAYQGPCPARLVFTGTITLPGVPTKQPLTYQWVRADRTRGPKRTVTMTGTTVTVTDKMQVGIAGQMIRVGEQLEVLAPATGKSAQVLSAVLCH